MRIFITGVAGFIGFHLALFLKKRGAAVFGCDNFNSYYDPELKRQRAQILQEHGIEVTPCDIREIPEKLLLDQGITHFVHLAAQAGVRHSLRHPEAYVQTNLDGFVQVLELLRKHPHIKLIYASSSSVYGMNKKVPFSESDPTDSPCSLYGATKKSNEALAHAYHSMYGLSVTGLRYFTVYGPWGRPDMAYFSFTKAILEGKPIQIFNQGQMQRDFTYIDDIVAGTAAAIDLGAACEIFNLGNNKPEGVLDLVRILEKQLGKTAQLELLPTQASEVPITFADIEKSRRQLGFSPAVPLHTGLQKFLEWFLDYRKSSR